MLAERLDCVSSGGIGENAPGAWIKGLQISQLLCRERIIISTKSGEDNLTVCQDCSMYNSRTMTKTMSMNVPSMQSQI